MFPSYWSVWHAPLLLYLSAQSTQLNKARLRILQRREEHIQDLFTSAREKLLELSKDEGRYVQLIEGIIVQVRILNTPLSPYTIDKYRFMLCGVTFVSLSLL